jgi:ABC-2 type transport system ATP-binding protein
MMVYPIEAQGLVKIYRSPFLRRKIQALRGLDFNVKEGEIFGLLGPNGAGKTTTLKIIVWLIRPTSGNVKVLEESPDKMPRERIGYLPENPYFYNHLTGYELLRFHCSLFGIRDRKIIERVVDMVGIGDAIHRRIKTYSKGMLQRVGIAQALVNNPDLVILDEPLAGLDPIGRKEMKDVILTLKEEGKTVLISSHILPDMEMICDRVGIMHRGKMISIGNLSDIADIEIRSIEVQVRDINFQQMTEWGEPVVRGNDVFLNLSNEEEVENFLRWAIDNGGKIIAVTPSRKSLEEHFMEKIRKEK